MPASTHTQEVRRFFDRQAATWSSQYQSGQLTERSERFLGALRTVVPHSAHVLDIGCGSGDITLAAAAEGWTLTGCDLSANMIATASGRDTGRAVEWVRLAEGNRALPFGDASFDAAYSSSVVEYMEDPAAHFRDVARVVRPNGVYVISVPDMRHPARLAEQRKLAVARSRPLMTLLRLTRWGAEYDYLRGSINRWPLERWQELLRDAGFQPSPLPSCEHPLALLRARRT